ncbi:MAG: glycosyltransferase, partial [Rhizobiaceae bacterium]|nr:glycosyltransferase [Rhizobiaceae bacterium]
IARHLAAASSGERDRAARLSLSGERPDLSARHVLTGVQGMIVASAVMTLAMLAILTPGAFFQMAHLVVIPVYLGAIGLRLCAAASARPQVDSPPLREPDELRPVYTVLVALYRESEVAADLVAALSELSWPRSKLDVMLVCEGDDPETIAAVQRAVEREPGFRIVVVPPSLPRTKPKALNYALPLATGEFVVLYDAEDRPHPDQLETAFRAMRAGGENLACLQAPLVIRNGERHWLAGHFALEYAALVRGMLPFLARLGLPLPLGGTSNHFRRASLHDVGAWDSHNVTEDADLGIRLSRSGYRVETIACPTFEDAPERWRDWRNQRTRWMKGWMLTWLVHMRHPARLVRDLGPTGFLALQLVFFGMVASTIAHPFFLGFLAYTAVSTAIAGLPDMATRILIAVDLVALVLGYVAFALLAVRTLDTRGKRKLRGHLWSLTAYWCLISLASARAFRQLIINPHMWEKTPHGPSTRAKGQRAPTARVAIPDRSQRGWRGWRESQV